MPLPPLPQTPGIEHHLRLDGGQAVLGVPARDFRMQALLVLLLLPVVWLLLGLLFALTLPQEGATALAEYLGQVHQVPVDTRRASTGLGLSPEQTAALCYIPVQGLWLVFSLFALVLARDPQVRFAARQSLVYYPLSGIVLVVVIIPFATVAALLPDDDLRGLAAVLVILLILPLALGRLGVGIWALVRAWQGRPQAIPGLGWLLRRWLPPAQGRSIDR